MTAHLASSDRPSRMSAASLRLWASMTVRRIVSNSGVIRSFLSHHGPAASGSSSSDAHQPSSGATDSAVVGTSRSSSEPWPAFSPYCPPSGRPAALWSLPFLSRAMMASFSRRPPMRRETGNPPIRRAMRADGRMQIRMHFRFSRAEAPQCLRAVGLRPDSDGFRMRPYAPYALPLKGKRPKRPQLPKEVHKVHTASCMCSQPYSRLVSCLSRKSAYGLHTAAYEVHTDA